MSSRRRAVQATAEVSVKRVLRRRRNVEEPVVAEEGDIVNIPDGEDFTLGILKKCPVALNNFRAGDYLHVSDLLGKCMRKIAISEKFSLPMPSGLLHESMALTFAQGTAIHDHIKGRVVKGHPDKLFGTWSCKCGALETEPCIHEKAKDKICPTCGGAPSNYNELVLKDPDLMLKGSPDITLYLSKYRVYYPVEIKSINHEDWKELARPKPDHVLQVLFYWYLLRKLGYPVPQQISILYATKGFIFKTPYKEFQVFPESNLSRLDDYLEEARALKVARNGGELPPRTFCTSRDCKDAKECHVVNVCFQHR